MTINDFDSRDTKVRASAGFSITARLKITNQPGNFAVVVQKLANLGASLAEVTLIYGDFEYNVRDLTINCKSVAHAESVIKELNGIPVVTVENWHDNVIKMHRDGKLNVVPKEFLRTRDQLAQAYTPGVARICELIHQKPDQVFDYTIKGHTVAIVTDGSAVLGLGNIGARAGLPVMEGKAMLFKQFAGIDAFPICLETQDTEEIIQTIKTISPSFGGINLEDISAPRCFEIEERLRKELDIPVFHDDQHGTACVVLAGVLNALKIVGKKISDLRIVVSGYGAGGVACTRMLLRAGAGNIIPCDSMGIVHKGRSERMNPVKTELLKLTNLHNETGTLADALRGADVFIGVSKPGVVTPQMIKTMARDPIVFALANPTPEIMPGELEGIARVVATGRSDYANQINNVLCFPGLFKGALEVRSRDITENMIVAASHAIADAVKPSELSEKFIIPSVFNTDVAQNVSAKVRECAKKDGVARI